MSESNACIRILHVIGSMELGGAETSIMNLYRNIDRSKIQFDIVVHTNGKMFYSDEIASLGGKVYCAPQFKVYNLSHYKSWWNQFFKQHPEYRIVHGHIGSVASIYLKIAKEHGRTTIAHSHRTKGKLSLMEVVFRAMTFSTRYIADYFMACSIEAGRDRYGEKVVDSSRFQVINNGIDAEKYRFSCNRRERCRAELEIQDHTIVWGHVGRFVPAKNHKKIIDVFYQFHKRFPDSLLLLFGEGKEKDHILELVKEMNLIDAVRFMGLTDKIDYYLQAMDIFIFPSIFEGLGIALIEAEAAGLPCIVSDAIVDEADIGAGLIDKIPLTEESGRWADRAVEALGKPRIDTMDYVVKSGFDIKSVAMHLQKFYLDHWDN